MGVHKPLFRMLGMKFINLWSQDHNTVCLAPTLRPAAAPGQSNTLIFLQ